MKKGGTMILMPLDTSKLRLPGTDFPAIKERLVTLVRVSANDITQAVSQSEKSQMLNSMSESDTVIAVWTGQWRSDVFQVPAELLARWKQQFVPDAR